MPLTINIATNQPWIGGGEVMLFHLAEAASDLGHSVTVVAPSGSDVAHRASEERLRLVEIHAANTSQYLRGLRRWATAARRGVLWCNGLRPAFATTGLPQRVVHLHRLPSAKQRSAAEIGRARALATLVPSQYLASHISGSVTMPNWTSDLGFRADRAWHTPVRLGFLGRDDAEKGLDDLVAAGHLLRAAGHEVEVHAAGTGDHTSDRALVRHGWTDPATFFDLVDLLVVPSRRAESFGLVAAEAMAAGVPVVVTDAGALPEVVGCDDRWVASAGSIEGLAATISAVLASDERAARVQAARRHWEAHHSPTAGRSALAAVLDDLTERLDRAASDDAATGKGDLT